MPALHNVTVHYGGGGLHNMLWCLLSHNSYNHLLFSFHQCDEEHRHKSREEFDCASRLQRAARIRPARAITWNQDNFCECSHNVFEKDICSSHKESSMPLQQNKMGRNETHIANNLMIFFLLFNGALSNVVAREGSLLKTLLTNRFPSGASETHFLLHEKLSAFVVLH